MSEFATSNEQRATSEKLDLTKLQSRKLNTQVEN